MGHYRSDRDRSTSEAKRTLHARASLEIEQAAVYLETLAQALRAGGVTIRSGSELLALRVAERAELKLQAGEEGRHSVLRVELQWETPVPAEPLEILSGIVAPNKAAGLSGSWENADSSDTDVPDRPSEP